MTSINTSGVTAPRPAKLNKRYRNILRSVKRTQHLSEFKCGSVINRDVGKVTGRLMLPKGEMRVIINDTCSDRANSDLLVIGTEYGVVTIHQITAKDDSIHVTSNTKAKFVASYNRDNSYLSELFSEGQVMDIDRVENFINTHCAIAC